MGIESWMGDSRFWVSSREGHGDGSLSWSLNFFESKSKSLQYPVQNHPTMAPWKNHKPQLPLRRSQDSSQLTGPPSDSPISPTFPHSILSGSKPCQCRHHSWCYLCLPSTSWCRRRGSSCHYLRREGSPGFQNSTCFPCRPQERWYQKGSSTKGELEM